ncbi:MAG: hypothetical protein V7641_5287 [Blastocatellia bacterium]
MLQAKLVTARERRGGVSQRDRINNSSSLPLAQINGFFAFPPLDLLLQKTA